MILLNFVKGAIIQHTFKGHLSMLFNGNCTLCWKPYGRDGSLIIDYLETQ
jgi:hypothetical protein